MLTPRFKINQDDKFVTISIYAPFTHVSETEVFMDGTDFRFFSKPYFLRLHFPCSIEETDAASAKFDADSCSYVIKCPKVNHGEYFPNLDMITELCKPEGTTNVTTIEELIEGSEVETDWYFEQTIPSPNGDEKSLKSSEDIFGIGFGMTLGHVFEKLLEESQEILDIKDPEKKCLKERRNERLNKEESDFDPDHYLCDLFEVEENIKDLLNYDLPPFESEFNEDENLILTSYTNKKTKSTIPKRSVMFGLVDILYAFCYDQRTTLGDHSTESGWLISKLSSTLVCNDVFDDLKDCVTSNFRRSLIYPLYRNFQLCQTVLEDLRKLLNCGRVSIIKALLKLTKIFNDSEGRYLFNQLYIDRYIAWIQTVKDSHFKSLSEELSLVRNDITKSDLDLELDELEFAAKLVQDEKEEHELINEMKSVKICDRTAKDESDDSDSSEDSDDDSETETSSESESEHDK